MCEVDTNNPDPFDGLDDISPAQPVHQADDDHDANSPRALSELSDNFLRDKAKIKPFSE